MKKDLYGMSMEEKDIFILNELEEKYKTSGLMSVLYWTIQRKINKVENPVGCQKRDLVDLANKVDELEQFAIKIGQ